MAEGFLLFEMNQGEQRELINIKGFTKDIRKATGTANKQTAMGVAKFAVSSNESNRRYFCILEATNFDPN